MDQRPQSGLKNSIDEVSVFLFKSHKKKNTTKKAM